jgi:hypothetical protein
LPFQRNLDYDLQDQVRDDTRLYWRYYGIIL